MPVYPGLCRRRRIGPHEIGIAVRQIHDEKIRLLLDTADDDNRFAKICLRMARRMGQRHEHLPGPPLMLTHVILDDRIAAGEAMLSLKPFP